MSKLIIAHQPCPWCPSSDAYAEYDTYSMCYSCKRSKDKPKDYSKSYFQFQDEGKVDDTLDLSINSMPFGAMKWLAKRYIYQDLISKYNLKYIQYGKWRPNTEAQVDLSSRIMYEVVSDGKYLRLFRAYEDNHKPKIITMGDKGVLFWSFTTGTHARDLDIANRKTIVIVEDFLSCMRVGEFLPCVALLGTSISDKTILTIIQKYETIVIWLDGDEPGRKAANKLEKRIRNYKPNSTFQIVTKEDPKCYSNAILKEHLAPYIK